MRQIGHLAWRDGGGRFHIKTNGRGEVLTILKWSELYYYPQQLMEFHEVH